MTRADHESILESEPDGHLVLRSDLTIAAVSDAYLATAGKTREAVVGRHVFEVFPESDRQKRVDPVAMRFAQLLENAPDAIVVVDAEMRIQFVNAQTERIFGYSRDELLGAPLGLLVPDRLREAHDRQVRRYLERPTMRAVGNGNLEIELIGRRKDGSEVPIEINLSPSKTDDGTIVSAAIRDISDRRGLESELRRSAGRLASAVESMDDGFALFDAERRLVVCNSVYRVLLDGSAPGKCLGASFAELAAAWKQELVFDTEADASRFAQVPQLTSTLDLRTRDGRRLRFMTRRTAEGGLLTTIWDLTEDERRAQELREARIAAEAGSEAKSEFLASMSHELRTPLNAILGFAQLLQRDKKAPLDDRHRDRVDQILKGGEHLLHLIDDILQLSKIEAGTVALSMEPVCIEDVVTEVFHILEPVAERQGVSLVLAPLPPLPAVRADRTRLVQVALNFGSNAIKYNHPGGSVTFAVERLTDERVRIAVSDTGIGVPADKRDSLFKPFQRAGQEMGPVEGTGIGLAITKRLAELMGGGVGFRSSVGEGSSFWIEMQLDPAAVLKEKSLLPTPLPSKPAKGHHMVLYVEDNPANVSFMRDLVASTFEDLELVCVPNAELGIELARARRPEVILMDINLPGMSGLDALRTLQKLPETSEIPVVALTAAASEHDRRYGEKSGFFRYLTKPVRVAELVSVLDGILQQGKQGPSAHD